MKRYIITAIIALLSTAAYAQVSLAGNWEGKLDAGGRTLRLVFKITEEQGKYAATMASPDQGAAGIPVSSLVMQGDSVFIDARAIGAEYKGVFRETVIMGRWHQGGMSLPLELARTEKPTELERPQTPKPPFAYMSHDVTFTNADKSITYGGTLTIPKGIGKHPAVLLITGSGPQNRDEEIAGHKPFAVIADYLTDKGYIVLRVDDRGVGQTTGRRQDATSADYAQDASAAIDYLRTRPEVNLKKIGLLGHSEGGMIAPMVANKRNDINFIIMLAGPGIRIYELMEDQSAALMAVAGVSETIIADYRKLYRGLIYAIISSTEEQEVRSKMITYIQAWNKTVSKEAIELVGTGDKEKMDELLNEFVRIYEDPWYNYFLKYDPQPELRKLSCNVLALNGSRDIQVLPNNLDGIRSCLEKSKSNTYETKELPGLNHLFQACTTCSPQEYGKLTETISSTALQNIKDWMDKNVK